MTSYYIPQPKPEAKSRVRDESAAKLFRRATLESLRPDDELTDQMIRVGTKIYRLHSAITATQSGFFSRNHEAILQKNRIGQPFIVDDMNVTEDLFDRIVSWFYSARGFASADDFKALIALYKAASDLDVDVLLLRILEVVAADENGSKFPGGDAENILELLNLAYKELCPRPEPYPDDFPHTKSFYSSIINLCDRLCDRFLKTIPVSALIDLEVLDDDDIDWRLRAYLRERLDDATILVKDR
ncbi:hypothetical protein TWF481_003152 [Arthrobotrys musiformis]|uniref:BTB domain-containing protein n=1 Tax=Arthrobotrys musiformis TaxID=47236 RepID=A0AAV9VRJ8_9PEZI